MGARGVYHSFTALHYRPLLIIIITLCAECMDLEYAGIVEETLWAECMALECTGVVEETLTAECMALEYTGIVEEMSQERWTLVLWQSVDISLPIPMSLKSNFADHDGQGKHR